MGSPHDAPTPEALDPEAATLSALGDSGSGPALLDVGRENARSQIRARLFQIRSEPIRFGRYILLSNLGEGGTGIVYAAYDDKLDRKVAIKVLRPEVTEKGLGAKRLFREARAMARLSDPNIVAVHEAGEQDDQVFIAMEFIRGKNAAEWLREGERSTSEILGVYRQAARGLIAAHEAGLVHRDFKPHNVLVGDDGVVKVVDFGLARTTREPVEPVLADSISAELPSPEDLAQTRLTRTGAIVGTPAYMSPEQYAGQSVDARSDQFSFCVALYEALYGEHPFVVTSLGELMASICEGRVREAPEGRVPPWIRRSLLRGLSVDPSRRFDSMQELVHALAHDPTMERRRWLHRGILAALVFGGGFGLARMGSRAPADAPAPCNRGSSLVAGLWDEARRREVETALSATALPYARDTWTRADDELQRHVAAWADAHDDACRKHRDGEQSGELLDRRMACLSRHRAALDALTSLLARADPRTIEHAVDAVSGLPPLSRCSDVDRLLADLPAPDDPRVAQQVEEHRQTLARVRVLEHTGHWDEGRDQAEQVVRQARALGHDPLLVEAQLRLGGILLMQMKGAEAEAALDDAFEGGVRAGHHRVAAEALARRLFVESELLGEPQLAGHDIALARALADFVDHAGTTALLLNNVGAVYGRQGDLPQSRRALEAAIDAQRRPEGRELLSPGVPLNNLALSLVSEGRYSDALARLEELDAMRRELYGPSHPLQLETRANQSLVLAYLHRHAESERMALETLREQERLFGADSLRLLRALEVLQELAIRRRRYDEARRVGARAREIATRTHGPRSPIATGLSMQLGHTYWQLGEHQRARELVEDVIATIDEALGPDHPYLANTYQKWGDLLRSTHPQEAAGYLDKALAIYEAQGRDTHLRCSARLARARLYQATGEPAKAEAGMTRALAELEAIVPEQSPQVAEATWRLGALLRQRGTLERAVPMLERAWRIHEALRDPDDPELALVAFDLLRARAEQVTRQGRPRPPGLGAQLERLADRLRGAGPGYRQELALIESWRAGAP